MSPVVAVVAGPTAMWYLTRGTGVVALILLTLSVALGVGNVRRLHTPKWPRFVLDAMHRNVSLVALAFLLVHIVTSILDGFAAIRLVDAVVPFTASYRPFWLGLGAVASDLLIAVALTSVMRRRLGYRAWRTVHWLAYACWPVALLHGLGTGSDTKAAWILLLNAGCVVVVLIAVWMRVTAGWPEHRTARASALAASAAGSLALLLWLPTGPLAAGWARRSGTPSSLLGSAAASGGGSAAAAAAATATTTTSAGTAPATFSAQLSGTVRQGQLANGLVEVELSLALSGQQLSALDIRIEGQPLAGGGVAMTASSVTLGTASDPAQYRGTITGLSGANIAARVRSASGASVTLSTNLNIDAGAGTATGTVNASPGG